MKKKIYSRPVIESQNLIALQCAIMSGQDPVNEDPNSDTPLGAPSRKLYL